MSILSGRRKWPLVTNVIVALALALLPLGVLAVAMAARNYLALDNGEVSLGQAFAIAAPILMWGVAMVVGWLLASRLVVRPLTEMRARVERYSAGDHSVRLGSQRTRSLEVAALARAFDGMADAIARHDAEQAVALAEQQRLTREVHHRVKNNLQIVSSLLSLQARDAANEAVAHAYAVVQSRVAALAVVHRWMYEAASPGGDAGVDLRALSTDLCAGLEQSLALSEHLAVDMNCAVDALFVAQDTAVPIAFLITELVSCAARLTAPAPLTVQVTAARDGERAELGIHAACFVGHDVLAPSNADPCSRIVHGMARQLRSPLRHDADAGCYAISFPVVAAKT